jgi:transposase-like protein
MPLPHDLTPKQAIAAMELARGAIIAEAANIAGVNEKTVDRWKGDQAFREAIAQARVLIWEQAIGKVLAGLDGAIAALTAIAEDAEQPASSRVSAAKTLLDTAQRHLESAALQQQVAALEEKIDRYRGDLK